MFQGNQKLLLERNKLGKQKGYRKGLGGMKEQVLVDKVVLKHRRKWTTNKIR